MVRTLDQHLFDNGPKRILSLDGGGVRGLITLGILKKVEDILRQRSSDPENFRLCHYFDLIGGTSTGALIATLLALGESVDDVTRLYMKMCPQIFGKRRLFAGFWSRFNPKQFEKHINAAFNDVLTKNGAKPHDPTLGSPLLKTGLAVVTKRIDTGAAWILSNNPRHKFWCRDSAEWQSYWNQRPEIGFYANRDYSLKKVAQASASAPFYLDAIDLEISEAERGLFLDGGASPFNNPCQELFHMTTLKAYNDAGEKVGASPHGFGWETGADNIFMLSVGTGKWKERQEINSYRSKPAIVKAGEALRGIISDAEKANIVYMQAISESPRGHYIDLNLEDMVHLRITKEPLLTFSRVNPDIDANWLERNLGAEFAYSYKMIHLLKQMDRPDKANLKRCQEIGIASGELFVSDADFPRQFDTI